ncbi:MAG TPA: CHAT domain-containing protein, partial [Thermoanaerobaculia bacterium]
ADPRLLTSPLAAGTERPGAPELALRLNGPAAGLGIPYELLTDGGGYLCRRHVMSRQMVHSGPFFSHKTEPFRQFVQDLGDKREPLRVLLVAANSDGKIPGVEEEIEALAASLPGDLDPLGLEARIDVLRSRKATYSGVLEALRRKHHHVLHFAGHGRRDTTLPEVGGLILRNGRKPKLLSAAELHEALRGSALRLAFLSSCFGGDTAAEPGRGDFRGVLEAVAGADVPAVVAYRWAVADAVAATVANSFYSALWRTLSPGDAMLAARRACASEYGVDDETWASPVLLMQTS